MTADMEKAQELCVGSVHGEMGAIPCNCTGIYKAIAEAREEGRAEISGEVREVVGATVGLLEKGLSVSVSGPTHAALSDLLTKLPKATD